MVFCLEIFSVGRVALIRGGICSFRGRYPQKCHKISRGIKCRNTLHIVTDKALQANELAMLSNIGDISEDVHTYVLVA